MDDEVKINIPNMEERTVIKIIGVGGGGGNAANYMFNKGIHNVDFLICNTDAQVLNASPIPNKILLGDPVQNDHGLGAGNKPEKGRAAAEFSLEEIKQSLSDGTEMIFITAGMGGGTGTGAAPIIANLAKSMGILTIGIVTIPFFFEGRERIIQALKGVEEMRKNVDSMLIISTEKLRQIYPDANIIEGFAKINEIMASAAKGIAEIITIKGNVNCDLNDVRTIMKDSGDAVMGSAVESGPDRATNVIKNALNSPLLLSTDLKGAKNILINISYGPDAIITMQEMTDLTEYVTAQTEYSTDKILWGDVLDETLGDSLSLTIVATGFPNTTNQCISGTSVEKMVKVYNQSASNPINIQVDDINQNKTAINPNFKFDPLTGLPNPDYKPNEPLNVERPNPEPEFVDINQYYNNINNNVQTSGKNFNTQSVAVEQKTEIPTVTIDLDNEEAIEDLEKVSAYKRKRGCFENHKDVNDNEISSFSISKQGKSICINEKNSFMNNRPD